MVNRQEASETGGGPRVHQTDIWLMSDCLVQFDSVTVSHVSDSVRLFVHHLTLTC